MDYKSEAVRLAYDEWQQAINIFNNVTAQEDINFAVFNLEAKRKKYLIALRASDAKEENAAPEFKDFV